MGSTRAKTLQALLQRSPNSSDPDVKLALSRLSAEIAERLNRGASSSLEFFTSAYKLLGQLKGVSHSELRMSCLYSCGQFFYNTGHPSAALDVAGQLKVLAERTDVPIWKARSCLLSGITLADCGNVAEALVQYSSVLRIAREIDDPYVQLAGWVNVGVALNYGGLYRDAIASLRTAASLSLRFHNKEVLAKAYTNLAQSYFCLEEYEEGFEAISKSLALSAPPQDSQAALALTIREFTFVEMALSLGKVALAREHAESCRRYGAWGDGRRSQALAKAAQGLCEIYIGSPDAGAASIEAALLEMEDLGGAQTSMMLALVRGLEEAGKPERALEHLQSLLAHIRKQREKGIYALLRIASDTGPAFMPAPANSDLRSLEFREATLRAKVAEREVVNSRIEMLERLAITADLKEEPSGEHGYRVGRLSALMAEQLGWTKDACHAIDLAARLHDIGKIAVPDRILLNTKELQEAERHFMSTHTIIGAELLAKSNIPHLKMAEEIARSHHEWWDGNGYPSKLSGARIPLHARIVALADVFDALTHGRPFASPWPLDMALDFIRERSGSQFDPALTGRFIELVQALRAKHRDLDAYLARAGRNSPFVQARNKIRMLIEEEQLKDAAAAAPAPETIH